MKKNCNTKTNKTRSLVNKIREKNYSTELKTRTQYHMFEDKVQINVIKLELEIKEEKSESNEKS